MINEEMKILASKIKALPEQEIVFELVDLYYAARLKGRLDGIESMREGTIKILETRSKRW